MAVTRSPADIEKDIANIDHALTTVRLKNNKKEMFPIEVYPVLTRSLLYRCPRFDLHFDNLQNLFKQNRKDLISYTHLAID